MEVEVAFLLIILIAVDIDFMFSKIEYYKYFLCFVLPSSS